jgi:hypothetical protein
LNRLQSVWYCLIALLVVAISPARPLLAFATGGSAWPNSVSCSGTGCQGQPFTINYTIGNILDGTMKFPNETTIPPAQIRQAIEEALGVWTTAVNVNFVEVPSGPLTQLRFNHVYINGADPLPPADPIAKAQATCIGYGFGCEVQYDEGDRWQQVGTTPNPDFLGATIHEVGHILGLNHTNVVGANMYWIFHRFTGPGSGTLFPDDIAGIRQIYGAGQGSVTPIAVPEPTAGFLLLTAAMGVVASRRRRRLE